MFGLFKKNKSETERQQPHLEKYTFIMKIEDIFSLLQSGIVVVGKISKGTIYNDSPVLIIDVSGKLIKQTWVTGLEIPPNLVDSATKGQHVGMKIENLTKEEINIGNYIVME